MVADNQFSALGLVLLSELSTVARIIRSPAYAVRALGNSPPASVMEHQDGDAASLAEDMGEAVLRISTDKLPLYTEGLQPNDADQGASAHPAGMPETRGSNDHSVLVEASAQVPSSWTRRQRRKGRNAIDDLFSGLD